MPVRTLARRDEDAQKANPGLKAGSGRLRASNRLCRLSRPAWPCHMARTGVLLRGGPDVPGVRNFGRAALPNQRTLSDRCCRRTREELHVRPFPRRKFWLMRCTICVAPV